MRWIALPLLMSFAASAQQSPHIQKILDEARQNELRNGIRPDAVKVAEAAGSQETLWAFLFDPGTTYDDRMLAAERAKDVLGPRYIPLLVAAKWTLANERWHHSWWQRAPDMPQSNPTEERVLFDKPWRPPTPPVKPGNTIEEWRKMPWPWQLERALERIHIKEGTTPFVDVARDLPCTTDDDEHVILNTMGYFPPTPESLGMLRNLVRRKGERSQMLFFSVELLAPWDADWAAQAYVADVAPLMTSLVSYSRPVGRTAATPYTALLAYAERIDELATEPDSYCRLDQIIEEVMEAHGDRPLPKHSEYPTEGSCQARLAVFHDWLVSHREELQKGAAAESLAIAAARARMDAVTLCQ